MVSRTLNRALLGIVLGGVLLALPTAAAAQQNSTFVIPFSAVDARDALGNPIPGTGALQNPCTAEEVEVTGTSTVTLSTSVMPDGDTKISVGVVTKGTGIGLTSLGSYAFSESQQFVVRTPIIGPSFDSTFADKLSLKGAKSIDNWVVRAHFRLKVSDTGALQVVIDSVNADQCKG